MKRYYLELNGVFVKDSTSLKIITRHYEKYHKRYKDSVISVYDKQTGEYIFWLLIQQGKSHAQYRRLWTQ